MVQKSIFDTSVLKVFGVFVENPLKIFYVKEISRKIGLAHTSVKAHLKNLEKDGIITKKKGERFFGFVANRESDNFLFYKKILNLVKLKESGLMDFLIRSIYPKAIVLYGSYFRGEDVLESDIDIFVLSNTKKNFDLVKFERTLKRKIHLIVEDSLKKLSKNLIGDILNGVVMYGRLENV